MIVVCGNLSLDTIVRPVDQVVWDTTAAVESIDRFLGGNGANCAYTLAQQGVPVTLISLAGADALGDELVARLQQAGVECRVQRGELPTSMSVSLVDSAGRRALLYQLGASAGEFEKPWSFPQGATHLHLSAIYRMRDLRAGGAAILEAAKRAGMTTSVDAQWDHLGEWPALPACDILFLNQDEELHLKGYEAETVVVKLGARGCSVERPGESFHEPGLAVEAVDTTGAGDCFCGAYLAALYRGEGHRGAARLANEAAALWVSSTEVRCRL